MVIIQKKALNKYTKEEMDLIFAECYKDVESRDYVTLLINNYGYNNTDAVSVAYDKLVEKRKRTFIVEED